MLRTILFVILTVSTLHAAEPAAPSLTGSWSGAWTDSRPAYGNSGGPLTCTAVEKAPLVWTCTFKLGQKRQWIVDLKGQLDKGELVFEGVYDVGSTQGLYTLKARLSAGTFTATYDGPGETGTFRLTK